MIIRTMTIEDYEGVYELWINTPGMGLNTTDDSYDGIGKYLKRNPDTSFVAIEEGRIIGIILAGHDGRRGYIHHTAVLPEHRRKGIGKALLENAMKALEAQGISKVALVVFVRNEDGNAFWENMGFTEREDLVYRNRNIIELERIDT
ncbi:MAG: GNAT family N-acetyltransferase [Erysipelotrichaceae bacterium]|nr:GNAT family N-acetyltransferase [Erysipelotrichaceae bacterium]